MPKRPMPELSPRGSSPVRIIAEVAQAHDGSLGTALAYVDAVARAGADAVKFQTHIANAESTPHEPWRVKFSAQDETRYDYWRRMEFTESQWQQLRARAEQAGIEFLSSPFSMAAVELLERVGVAAWKIASGEVRSVALLDRIARSGLPVYLSTGMSPWAEIDDAVAALQERGVSDIWIFQCTSMYPTPPEQVGLNVLIEFRGRYPHCRVGLSDHSGTIFPGLAAAALGADAVEVHVCFSRQSFGPDVPASLTVDELAQLVRGVRFLENARATPVDKDALAEELAPLRALFMKSAVLTVDLPAGTVLLPEHLAAKKPGSGMPAERIPELVGRRLLNALPRDHLLSQDDLSDEPDA